MGVRLLSFPPILWETGSMGRAADSKPVHTEFESLVSCHVRRGRVTVSLGFAKPATFGLCAFESRPLRQAFLPNHRESRGYGWPRLPVEQVPSGLTTQFESEGSHHFRGRSRTVYAARSKRASLHGSNPCGLTRESRLTSSRSRRETGFYGAR